MFLCPRYFACKTKALRFAFGVIDIVKELSELWKDCILLVFFCSYTHDLCVCSYVQNRAVIDNIVFVNSLIVQNTKFHTLKWLKYCTIYGVLSGNFLVKVRNLYHRLIPRFYET